MNIVKAFRVKIDRLPEVTKLLAESAPNNIITGVFCSSDGNAVVIVNSALSSEYIPEGMGKYIVEE